MTQGDRDQRQKQAGHRDSAQPCDGFSESPSSWNTLHESQTAFLPDWRTDDVESLRPFADIRLIAADLDGTLLPDARSNLAPAIQRLQRSLFYASPHVRLTIATGRAYAGTASLAADLRIDKETPLIVYNGSLIVQPRIGRGMRQGFIRREALRQIVSTCLLHNATVLAYSHQSPLALDLALIDERVYGWSRGVRPRTELNGLPVTWLDTEEAAGDLLPIAVLVDTCADTQTADLRRCLSELSGVSCTASGTRYIEVRPVGSDKGAALARAAELLGILREQVLAIGDSDNDVEMLRWAGVGVSVAGASAMALAGSRFVCRHAVVAGVIEVLRLIRQARRYASRLVSFKEI